VSPSRSRRFADLRRRTTPRAPKPKPRALTAQEKWEVKDRRRTAEVRLELAERFMRARTLDGERTEWEVFLGAVEGGFGEAR